MEASCDTDTGQSRDVPWASLVRAAFSSLVDRCRRSAETPLAVILAADIDLAGLLGDLQNASTVAAPDTPTSVITGPELGRLLAADEIPDCGDLDRMAPLVIVDRIDRVGGPSRQAAGAAFLDAAARRNRSACVTVGTNWRSGTLHAALESRLAAGLVIHVPCRLDAGFAAPARPRSLAAIIRTTARRHGITPAAITGAGRARATVEARNLAMYLARRITGRSYGAIGASFGGRDHTTVMRGVKAVTDRLAMDAAFALDVSGLLGVDGNHGHDERRTTA